MVHASQVTLGDVEKVKKDETFAVYVKIGDDENGFMIGNLSQKFPQFSIDLYLGHEFEISHNSTSSVYLIGYRTFDAFDELYPFFHCLFLVKFILTCNFEALFVYP